MAIAQSHKHFVNTESQQRGFCHGHRKAYSIPTAQHLDIIRMFTNEDGKQVQEFIQGLKAALLTCAASLQYEDSTLPAQQMGQIVLPEKFTAKHGNTLGYTAASRKMASPYVLRWRSPLTSVNVIRSSSITALLQKDGESPIATATSI